MTGIALAVLSAAALSFGNVWQSRGVKIATARKGDGKFFLTVVKTPVWLLGTALYGVAILLQISSLTFAPLMLVQPIGVLALVFAVFLNPHFGGPKPTVAVYRAMGVCLVGVLGYVIIAAQVSEQRSITDAELVGVLLSLAAVLAVAGVSLALNRGKIRIPVVYVLLGGVFSAFVAALGKTVILRVQGIFAGHAFTLDSEGVLTLLCVIGIGIASALSMYFVQMAYTCNASDVVVAGTTVIDPAVSVVIGIVILHEAANAPPWSLIAIAVAGSIAVVGVLKLSKAETPGSGAPRTEPTAGEAPAEPVAGETAAAGPEPTA
ncbi:multidrug DMT transporter permease [Leucobacter luti]|nr:multidrug DMT transporter permease [Leucobacter luti]